MRKIILVSLLFLISQFCFGQTEPWWAPITINEDGLIEMVVNYELETKSQDQLYSITKVWLSQAFKNSNNVIEVDEKESGIISGNGNVSFNWGNVLTGLHSDPLFFTFKCQMKDGKYRLTVNNLQNENTLTGRNGIEYLFVDRSVKKNGDVKEYPAAVQSAVLNLFDMLKTSLGEKLNELDDF